MTALLKTPYTDKMTKSLLRGKTPNGVHTRETMAPQWLMTSKMAAHYDIASDPNSSSSLHSGDKLPHLKATPDVPNVPNVAKVPCEFVSVVSVFFVFSSFRLFVFSSFRLFVFSSFRPFYRLTPHTVSPS